MMTFVRTAVLLTAFVAMLGVAPPVVNRSSPAALAGSFYAWELHHTTFADDAATDAALKAFFTHSFYVNYVTVVHDDHCLNEANLDWDPWSGAQVAMASYRIGKTTMLPGDIAHVAVAITLRWVNGHTFAGQPVIVVAERGHDGWRMQDVIDARSGGLEANLIRILGEVGAAQTGEPGTRRPTAAQIACTRRPPP